MEAPCSSVAYTGLAGGALRRCSWERAPSHPETRKRWPRRSEFPATATTAVTWTCTWRAASARGDGSALSQGEEPRHSRFSLRRHAARPAGTPPRSVRWRRELLGTSSPAPGQGAGRPRDRKVCWPLHCADARRLTLTIFGKRAGAGLLPSPAWAEILSGSPALSAKLLSLQAITEYV